MELPAREESFSGATSKKVTPAGVEAILYSFTGGTDGDYPTARLTQDATGNIYGVTANGGTYGYGTVYQVTPTGVKTVLHSFAGGSDGNAPQSPIILDASGNLTASRREARRGTEMSKTHPFRNRSCFLYEAGPAGLGSGMVMDKSGNLYGTSWKGGRNHTDRSTNGPSTSRVATRRPGKKHTVFTWRPMPVRFLVTSYQRCLRATLVTGRLHSSTRSESMSEVTIFHPVNSRRVARACPCTFHWKGISSPLK